MADNRGDGNAMRAVWGGDELYTGGRVLVHGIAARADAGGFRRGSDRMSVPELSGAAVAGVGYWRRAEDKA